MPPTTLRRPTMSKPVLAIFCLIIGLTAGILLGYVLFKPGPSAPVLSKPMHYYYHLNDSTLARHTIDDSGSRVTHTVDTIRVYAR
jgi:hypothetical protein